MAAKSSPEPSCSSSPAAARRGSQEPRLRVEVGEAAYTEGPDACELAADFGLALFPWQEYVLGVWASRDSLGRPSYVTCGLDVPRQNGKNASLEAYELYLLAVCGWHILHTAHRVKTYKKAFRRLARYFEDRRHPELTRMVETIRKTNGEEGIYLANGGSIEFMARTNGGGRGFDDVQLVVMDEAQELTDAQYEAIMFTLAASSTGERQVIYTGTPPNEKAPGVTFAKTRRSVLSGTVRRSAWMSWAVESCPPREASFEDVRELVYQSNPSMGYLLDEEFTESEFAGSDIVGFARERLDWWQQVASAASAIPADDWERTRIDAIGDSYRGRVALAVRFSPDGAAYALAGCKLGRGRLAGRAAVELVAVGTTERGLDGLAQELARRARTVSAVWVDGLSGADVLCERLAALKVPRGYVVRPRTADVIAASTGLLDAVRAGTVAHTPSAQLDEAAARCVRRRIGSRGGWGFGAAPDDETTSPEPLEAAAGALWVARNTRRDPRRKQRMV